jgi:hypothetical protein
MKMKMTIDREADAIYIKFTDKPYSHGVDGEVKGIELLCVSHGVITNDLPFRSEIERMLGDKGVKLFA